MGDPSLAQLGISGIVVALLLVAIKIVWDKYQAALAAKDAITAAVLPVLQQANAALAEAAKATERLERLYGQPPRSPPARGR